MKKNITIKNMLLVIVMLMLSLPAVARQLGLWNHYNAYGKLTHVVPVGGSIFALSDGKLYSYNVSDDSYTEYNTTNYLNDHNTISDICYNSSTRSLIIAYEGGNIDLLNVITGNVRNISAISTESTTSTKEIVNTYCHGRNAYIVMRWGVVVLNTERKEITESYRLDTSNETVTDAFVEGDSLYVSSSEAIGSHSARMIRGAMKDNLKDTKNWYDVPAARISDIAARMLSARQSRNIYKIGTTTKNNDLIADQRNKCYWGSNAADILVKYKKAEDNSFIEAGSPKKPYGPSSNNFYNIYWKNNKLYTVGQGWIRDASAITNLPGIVQTMTADGRWQTYETPASSDLGHAYVACNDITVDPRDTSHVMVGSRDGLYEFRSGKFLKYYNNRNSIIKGLNDATDAGYNMVLTATYDAVGNLYLLNSSCSNGLLEWPAGASSMIHIPKDYTDGWTPYIRLYINAFIDSRGMLWFVNTHWYGVAFYVYNPQNKLMKRFEPLHNQDGSIIYDDQGTGYLRHISEDKEGNIWIAGTKGIAYVPGDQINNLYNTVLQHKVNRNDGTGLADYLLSTVDASCIIFDSANRMYVGTKGSGVYVISADRNIEALHYTTGNSHIMSDNVNYLALNEQTGELFISTDKGLCSVITDATVIPASMDKDNIQVYPNPVTPDYTGMITIEGLTPDADIKITTATGVVVHRGRSVAGIYQWDGCDREGKRCASGVYNILLATSNGEEGCVAKIAMVK